MAKSKKNKIGFNAGLDWTKYSKKAEKPKHYIGDDSIMKIEVLGGNPRIYSTPEAMQKMQAFTRICDNEIGWLGDVTPLGNMCYLITDVFLAEQTVSGATCNLTDNGLHLLYEERLMRNEDISNMKMWGHSHASMAAFASGQDDTELKRFTESAEGFFIRLIMNKKDEFHITFVDTDRQIQWTDLPITIWTENVIDEAAIRAEIKEKVTVQTYVTTVNYGVNNYPYYGAYGKQARAVNADVSKYADLYDDWGNY